MAAVIILTAPIGLAAGGCSDLENGDSQRSMKVSTGEYSRGYKDGMREAKLSLFDKHAGWMWSWMVEKEYADGYDRGWADGRRTLALEKEQEATDTRAARDALETREEK